jgi:hypothetical protein
MHCRSEELQRAVEGKTTRNRKEDGDTEGVEDEKL